MLIGFAGIAKSGKDTSCEILQHHNFISRRHAFADPIKKTCNALFGWDERHSFGELKDIECQIPAHTISNNIPKFIDMIKYYKLDSWGLSPIEIYSELMKHLYVMDGFSPDIYTSPREVYQVFGTEVGREKLNKDVWVLSAPLDDVCIPDVRFHNECDYLRSSGGIVIRINRFFSNDVRPHVSESYISELNVTDEYDNTGSLYDLESWLMGYFNIPTSSPRLHPDE